MKSTAEIDAKVYLLKLSVQARAGDKKAMAKARDLAVELALQQVAAGERLFGYGDRLRLGHLLGKLAQARGTALKCAEEARGARTAKLEALCAWAYETYSLKVTEDVDPTRWASFLRSKIDKEINRDLPENDPRRKKPPSLDFIRDWLRQNGILS